MVQGMLNASVPIDGVGLQLHVDIAYDLVDGVAANATTGVAALPRLASMGLFERMYAWAAALIEETYNAPGEAPRRPRAHRAHDRGRRRLRVCARVLSSSTGVGSSASPRDHSADGLTSTIRRRCDCGEQLETALAEVHAAEAGVAGNDAESLSDVSPGGGTTAMVDGADLAVTNTCFRLLLDPEPGVTTTVVADLFRGLDA